MTIMAGHRGPKRENGPVWQDRADQDCGQLGSFDDRFHTHQSWPAQLIAGRHHLRPAVAAAIASILFAGGI